MHLKIIFITFCMWLNISNGTILTLPSLIFGVFDAILTTKQILEETNIITSPTDVILEQLEIINDKLEGNFYANTKTHVLIRDLPNRFLLELRLKNLNDYMTRLDVNYRRFLEYAKQHDEFEKDTLIDFVRHCVSHDSDSCINLLQRVHELIYPTRRGIIISNGILHNLAQVLNNPKTDECVIYKQPTHQIIYDLYTAVALTELKGYTMIQFSYMILKSYRQGGYLKEMQLEEERFKTRIKLLISDMNLISRKIYRCDPNQHIKGITYDEVTELIQGYLHNEVDLNSGGTCFQNCAYYQNTKDYGCYYGWCKYHRRCTGRIYNCTFIESHMLPCPSAYSGRRYEYIQYESGMVLGQHKACATNKTHVYSWHRWLFWHCSYCMCLCDEAGPQSDRYFNLRPALSNITHNKVVTGLRFIKVNRIFHLQIQEGVLKPYGEIDKDTIRWVPVSEYKITNKNVRNGIDYHQMSWEQRAVDLDELIADKNHIVTGVKFTLVGSHLNFRIRITPFDFKNGTLIDPINKSVWKNNPNRETDLENPRTQLNLTEPDIPIYSDLQSHPDSYTNQYIEFVNTDLYKDVAQTTVPFIDIQPVEPLIKGPLSGAGIIHKGTPGFGGFLAPTIMTYDYREKFQAIFSDENSFPRNGNQLKLVHRKEN